MTGPLASSSNNTTLESVHVHGSNSHANYGTPVFPIFGSMRSLYPQQQPWFNPEGNGAPTTDANGLTRTQRYNPTSFNLMQANQPSAPLVSTPQHTIPLSPSITVSSSPISPHTTTLNATTVDTSGGNPHLSLSARNADTMTSHPLPSLVGLDEMNEDPPQLSPSIDPYSPPRKPRAQGFKVRKIMDDVPREEDIRKLQQRLRAQGGDEDAIARVPVVFTNGLSKNALRLRRRSKKSGSGKSINFDEGYMNFVGRRQIKKENTMGTHYEDEWWCRLCPPENRVYYERFKNLQPHLCSKHFGLPGRGKSAV
jgi:hypothetical protein